MMGNTSRRGTKCSLTTVSKKPCLAITKIPFKYLTTWRTQHVKSSTVLNSATCKIMFKATLYVYCRHSLQNVVFAKPGISQVITWQITANHFVFVFQLDSFGVRSKTSVIYDLQLWQRLLSVIVIIEPCPYQVNHPTLPYIHILLIVNLIICPQTALFGAEPPTRRCTWH